MRKGCSLIKVQKKSHIVVEVETVRSTFILTLDRGGRVAISSSTEHCLCVIVGSTKKLPLMGKQVLKVGKSILSCYA